MVICSQPPHFQRDAATAIKCGLEDHHYIDNLLSIPAKTESSMKRLDPVCTRGVTVGHWEGVCGNPQRLILSEQ